ncbi:MAG TPA: hypothetical protein VK808_09040 [Bacteroidia bacterium]|nr:hypothetical protein [Bacteroidia bacterium]
MVKRFILKLALFLIPIVGLMGFIAYKLPKLPNTYNVKREYFEKQLDSIEVLILGNSHATWGIDPSLFSHKGFNLSNLAQSIYYDKELTLKYLPEMKKLKLVVITTSYFSLYYTMDRTSKEYNLDFWRVPFYFKFWDIKSRDETPLFDIHDYSMMALYYTEESQQYIYNGFHRENYYTLCYNGFMKANKAAAKNTSDSINNENINDSTGKRRVQLFNEVINGPRKRERFNNVMSDITTLIKELQKKNIRVVFVDLPVTGTCSKYFDQKIVEHNKTVLDSLCTQYGCKYFNYSDDTRFTIKNFQDDDHLNISGAQLLSKIINSDIIKPQLN